MKLTDAERTEVEAILLASDWPVEDCEEIAETITPAIERLIAARLEQQREALAAAIAQAREGFLPSDRLDPVWVAGWHAASDHQAWIVREYQPGEGT